MVDSSEGVPWCSTMERWHTHTGYRSARTYFIHSRGLLQILPGFHAVPLNKLTCSLRREQLAAHITAQAFHACMRGINTILTP